MTTFALPPAAYELFSTQTITEDGGEITLPALRHDRDSVIFVFSDADARDMHLVGAPTDSSGIGVNARKDLLGSVRDIQQTPPFRLRGDVPRFVRLGGGSTITVAVLHSVG